MPENPLFPCCHCLQDFPELEEDEVPLQRNEGQWEFTLDESEDSWVLSRRPVPLYKTAGCTSGCRASNIQRGTAVMSDFARL